MALEVEAEPAPAAQRADHSAARAHALGSAFGILAAVTYTGANIALKEVANPGDVDWAIWVTCVKAVPAALAGWIAIAWLHAKGEPALPPRRLLIALSAIGLLMQFGGNVLFQAALSLGGLALTVPLNFAVLILAGAWLGRMMLSEPITRATAIATVLTIASVIFLSFGADTATQSIMKSSSLVLVAGAILGASLAGASYGIAGVFLRRILTGDVGLPAALVLPSTIGVVVLGVISLVRMGPERLAQTTPHELWTMLIAGAFNAVAFFSVGAALARIPVNRLNLLNASQAAMAAVAGVLFFREPLTVGLAIGTVLAIAALLVLGGENRRGRPTELTAEATHD